MLVPMTQPEFLAYVEESVPAYAADKTTTGELRLAHARRLTLCRRYPRQRVEPGLILLYA